LGDALCQMEQDASSSPQEEDDDARVLSASKDNVTNVDEPLARMGVGYGGGGDDDSQDNKAIVVVVVVEEDKSKKDENYIAGKVDEDAGHNDGDEWVLVAVVDDDKAPTPALLRAVQWLHGKELLLLCGAE